MAIKTTTGHQRRSTTTRLLLFEAAERVFARDGFERAQLATIAREAGRTKGSIYGHFTTKDDLFLALYQHRAEREMGRVRDILSSCTDAAESRERVKEYLLELAEDQNWSLLTLEFAIYSVRNPSARERLAQAHAMTRRRYRTLFGQQPYGALSAAQKRKLDTSAAMLPAVLSAVAIEQCVDRPVLPKARTRELLSQLLNVLLSTQ